MSQIFCQHFSDPNNPVETFNCGISKGVGGWMYMEDTSTVHTASEAKIELEKLIASHPEARPFGYAAEILAG